MKNIFREKNNCGDCSFRYVLYDRHESDLFLKIHAIRNLKEKKIINVLTLTVITIIIIIIIGIVR